MKYVKLAVRAVREVGEEMLAAILFTLTFAVGAVVLGWAFARIFLSLGPFIDWLNS